MKRIQILILAGFALLCAAFTATSGDAFATTPNSVIVSSAQDTQFLAVQIDHSYTPKPGNGVYGPGNGLDGFPDLDDVDKPENFKKKATFQWWLNRIAWEVKNVPVVQMAFEHVHRNRPNITFEAFVYGHAKDAERKVAAGNFRQYNHKTGDVSHLVTAGHPNAYTLAREWYLPAGKEAMGRTWSLSTEAYGATITHLVIWVCGNLEVFKVTLWVPAVPVTGSPQAPSAPPTSPSATAERVEFHVAGQPMPRTRTTYVDARPPGPNVFVPLQKVQAVKPANQLPRNAKLTGRMRSGGAVFFAYGNQAGSQTQSAAQAQVGGGAGGGTQAEALDQSQAFGQELLIYGELPSTEVEIEVEMFDGEAQ